MTHITKGQKVTYQGHVYTVLRVYDKHHPLPQRAMIARGKEFWRIIDTAPISELVVVTE